MSPSSPVSDLSAFLHRLIFEEYFLFQTALLLKRRAVKKERGPLFRREGEYHTRILQSLPFALTEGQARVTRELAGDMTGGEPMNRLLQGDVGCGKTVCALLAACVALDSGYQVAVMAPTEILAEQHFLTIHRFFESLDIPVAFLRGGMGKERGEMLDAIREGRIPVVIGTHAILEGDVLFHHLGLVVIDEQHRFGVIQRKGLREKAYPAPGPAYPDSSLPTPNAERTFMPHVLVMTATPIPRTLAMVVYGDLDVSIIDQMPPGRQTVRTRVYTEAGRVSVYRIIEEEVKKKHQVFMVYPLVDASDKMEFADATNMARHFQEDIFPSCRVGLLHGRMKAEEKERVMETFKKGEIDILVCTTVIEVGIDVPNATVMVVEHAERFGLSQLHQLRGRVGRGAAPAKCLLISSARRTDVAAKRLKVMEETGDGFIVAEKDMEIRGPGDMFGVRQAGIPRFRVGSIVRDGHIMTGARQAAEEALLLFGEDEAETIRRIAAERWGSETDVHDVA